MKHPLLFSCCAVGALLLGVGVSSAGIQSAYDFARPSDNIYQVVNAADKVSAGAEKFVDDLAGQGIGFLSNEDLSSESQKSAFKKLLNKRFDMDTIARFSLGRHWRTASKAQRAEYLKLFKVMIVDVYSERFKDYQGQTLAVTGSRKEGTKDILVHSVLEQNKGPDVKVDWRVRRKNGRYQVIDVIVEGVSMALTQRSDFSSVVQRGGGDMEALLVHLRRD